ncbi:MAG: bile acid:sodium symporter family protein [Cellvibrionaceae bacterium]
MISLITRLFPLWAILFSLLAYWAPSYFSNFKSWIIPLLMLIMFGMGSTLKFDDFYRVLQLKRVVGLGVLLQYSVMPFAAFAVSYLFGLPLDLMVGMVLVGSASGGTASNVICYLAKGDVALSISLTLVSTLLAVFMLPALTWLYVGESVPVPALSMLLSVGKIVILPVLAGLIINTLWGSKLERVGSVFPLISVVGIVCVIAIIVALNQAKITSVGLLLVAAIALHNAIGLLGGYWGAKCLGYSDKMARTLSIEVGMQNSGLAVALALKYFGPMAAMPGALFSIWHNLTGSVLASVWSRNILVMDSSVER